MFAIIFVSVQAVYAKEKSWYAIDGIKFRYGSYKSVQELDISNHNLAKTSDTLDPYQFTGNAGRPLFPIIITFP